MALRCESFRKSRVLACSRACFGTHYRGDSIPAFKDVSHVGTLGGDGFGVVKLRPELYFSPWTDRKSPASLRLSNSAPNLFICRLTHAATERVSQDGPLVSYGFALENAFASECDCLLGLIAILRATFLLLRPLAGGGNNLLRLIAEFSGHLLVGGENLLGGKRLLPVTGRVRRNLRRLRAAVSGLLQLFFDLLRTGTRCIKVLLRVAFDLWCAAFPCLDFIAEIAELVCERRLVHGGRILLAFKESSLLQCPSGAIGSFGHVENDRMGVELGRSVAVHRASRVMLEFRSYEFARLLGGVVAADPCMCVALQLVQSGSDGGTMSISHPLIPAYEGRQRNGFGCGKGSIPSGPMFNRLGSAPIRRLCTPARGDV